MRPAHARGDERKPSHTAEHSAAPPRRNVQIAIAVAAEMESKTSPSMVGNKLYQQTCEYGNRPSRDITREESNTNFACMATGDFEHVLKIIEPIAKKRDAIRETPSHSKKDHLLL
ncbi:hypothetical protein PR048_018593 [Dryococelus australis]|uniref:Uncharacterized protein n=1 Tax=Dryococelus australis TaxID=614101 RepID=A0ABQ9HCN9_9NEOP|nr:hypothetical protein PR048_018593 [Dryococelus australis]